MMPANGLVLSLIEPAPMGIVIGAGVPSRRSRTSSSTLAKLAPTTSILLMNTMPRHVVLVRLPPHRFGLGLDALLGIEDDDGAIEHAQAALDLGREIDVARACRSG